MVNVSIFLEMDEPDFAALVVTACGWSPRPTPGELDNFEAVHPPQIDTAAIDLWTVAYHVGPDELQMAAARAYLDAIQEPHQVVWYRAPLPLQGFVILTNYHAPSLRQAEFVMPGHRRLLTRRSGNR